MSSRQALRNKLSSPVLCLCCWNLSSARGRASSQKDFSKIFARSEDEQQLEDTFDDSDDAKLHIRKEKRYSSDSLG